MLSSLQLELYHIYWVGQKFIQVVNVLCSTVLGVYEKVCILFLLKTEQTFWPVQ